MSPTSYAGPRPRQRRRPSAGWFVLGGLLVLLAPAVFVGGLVWTLRPMLSPEGHFPADGGQHRIDVPAHSRRAIFLPEGAVPPTCWAASADDGTALPVRSLSASYTSTFGGHRYRAYRTFDSGDGDVVVSCRMPQPIAPVRVYVAGVPSTTSVVTGVVASVVGPIVLGLAGLVLIVVVALLRSRRPAEPVGSASRR